MSNRKTFAQFLAAVVFYGLVGCCPSNPEIPADGTIEKVEVYLFPESAIGTPIEFEIAPENQGKLTDFIRKLESRSCFKGLNKFGWITFHTSHNEKPWLSIYEDLGDHSAVIMTPDDCYYRAGDVKEFRHFLLTLKPAE